MEDAKQKMHIMDMAVALHRKWHLLLPLPPPTPTPSTLPSRAEQQADLFSLPPSPSFPPVLSVQQYALQGPSPHYPSPPPPSSPGADGDTEDLAKQGGAAG